MAGPHATPALPSSMVGQPFAPPKVMPCRSCVHWKFAITLMSWLFVLLREHVNSRKDHAIRTTKNHLSFTRSSCITWR